MVAEMAEMIEKPLTEAQRIIGRLENEFGLTGAAIAEAIKVKADTVSDIKRRKATGNIQLYRLRKVISALESGGNPAENAGGAFPDIPVSSASGYSGDDPAAFSVTAEEPTPHPEKSITARAGDWLRSAMYGTSDAASAEPAKPASATKSAKGDDLKASFVDLAVPLVSLVIVWQIVARVSDPYKPVAPNQAEVQAMIIPPMRMLARRLEVTGKLSQDGIDLMASLAAAGLYAQRAIPTYMAIHEQERAHARRETNQPGYAAAAAGYAGAGDSGANDAASQPHAARPVQFNRRSVGEPARGAASADERRADAALADLLHADALGRARLGIG